MPQLIRAPASTRSELLETVGSRKNGYLQLKETGDPALIGGMEKARRRRD